MMLFAILGVVFVIVFVVSERALADDASFGRPASRVLAGCVATLSVLGLFRLGPTNTAPPSTDTVTVPLLLPYVALALSLIVLLVLSLLWRWFRRRERTADPSHETVVDRGWGDASKVHRDGFAHAIRRSGGES